MCMENGFQGEIMMSKRENDEGSNHYDLPEVSVIPPIETQGCRIDLYYNGIFLVNTFYLFKDKKPTSRFSNWTIEGHDTLYNKNHYHISFNLLSDESNDYSKSQGNNNEYLKLIIKH